MPKTEFQIVILEDDPFARNWMALLAARDWRTRVADDHWTVLTADGSLSVHFEHTIAITDAEPEVLTRGAYA